MDKIIEASLKVSVDSLTLADVKFITLENDPHYADHCLDELVNAIKDAKEAISDIFKEK